MFRHSSAAANSSDVQNYTMSNRGLLFLLHSRVLNRVLGVFAALALLPLILILSFAGWVIVGPKFLCRHARIGIDGKAFSLLSFRTIPLESSRDDRRANALCNFFGRTGLSALPQVLNVIKGEINLIGAYPMPPHIDVGDRHQRPGMFQQTLFQ